MENAHNKAFKRDSQRSAVLVFNLGFVFTEQWFGLVVKRCRPLTRRYVPNPLYVTWAVKFQMSYEIGCV